MQSFAQKALSSSPRTGGKTNNSEGSSSNAAHPLPLEHGHHSQRNYAHQISELHLSTGKMGKSWYCHLERELKDLFPSFFVFFFFFYSLSWPGTYHPQLHLPSGFTPGYHTQPGSGSNSFITHLLIVYAVDWSQILLHKDYAVVD